MMTLVATRKTIDTFIARVKGPLYQEVGEDKLSNLFDAKIINKTKYKVPITLKLEELEGSVKLVGDKEIVLKSETVNERTFFLKYLKRNKKRSTSIKIGVYKDGEKFRP